MHASENGFFQLNEGASAGESSVVAANCRNDRYDALRHEQAGAVVLHQAAEVEEAEAAAAPGRRKDRRMRTAAKTTRLKPG